MFHMSYKKITGLLNYALNGVLMWKNQLKYVDEMGSSMRQKVKKGQDRRFSSLTGLIRPDFLQAPRQEWYRLFTKTMHCYNINIQYIVYNIQYIYKYTIMKTKDTYKRGNIYYK